MTLTALAPRLRARRPAPTLEIAVPVYNEEAVLERNVRRLHAHMLREVPFGFRITIADNASSDRTWAIARRLAGELPEVDAIHLRRKGRGRALRAVWSASEADVVAYTDVDLSTDLAALMPLVRPLVAGQASVAIGSRFAEGAAVERCAKRELISRAYNLILRAALRVRFSDAQCGFKALRSDAAQALLPLVEDDDWFFDTELLVLCERAGLEIREVPVAWVEDRDSRVKVIATAISDLRGVARLMPFEVAGRRRAARPLSTPAGARL